jgi:hypothetical protein
VQGPPALAGPLPSRRGQCLKFQADGVNLLKLAKQMVRYTSGTDERDAGGLPRQPQLSTGRRNIHGEHESLAVTPYVVQVPAQRPRQPK